MDYLGQYNDMMKKMEALKDKDMTTEESLYYVEVTARIEKILLEVLQ